MTPTKNEGKQNLAISLYRQTIQKAKIFAARLLISTTGLLARQIEILVGEEEACKCAERQALTLLDHSFHLGGIILVSRDELHAR